MSKRRANPLDLTIDALPKNRREVFWDIVKLRSRTLFGAGLFLLACSLPLQLTAILKEMTAAAVYRDLADEILTAEDAATALITLSNQAAIFAIPLWLLFGLGLAGVICLIKRLAWAQPIMGTHDVLIGMRENGGAYALLFLWFGLLSYLANAVSNYATMTDQSMIYGILGSLPGIVFLIFLFPMGAYALITIAIYSTRFSSHVRLGLYLYMKTPFSTFLHLLVISLSASVFWIPDFYVRTIGRFVLTILVPFLLLKWFLLASDILDKHWNPKHYPELVHRGILGIKQEPRR